ISAKLEIANGTFHRRLRSALLITYFSTFPLLQLFHFIGPSGGLVKCSLFQDTQLLRRELAPDARLQAAIPERTDAHAQQLLHGMSDSLEHPAHLAVAPFANRDRQHAVAGAAPLVQQ